MSNWTPPPEEPLRGLPAGAAVLHRTLTSGITDLSPRKKIASLLAASLLLVAGACDNPGEDKCELTKKERKRGENCV